MTKLEIVTQVLAYITRVQKKNKNKNMIYRYQAKDQQSFIAVVESEANALHFDYISVRLRV